MRTNVTFPEIVNELYNIFSDDKSAAAYMADSFGPQYIGLCGWAGAMSPANRAAFVQTFGRDVTDRAEAEARARVDEYRAAVAASAYHLHELEADTFAAYGSSEKSQLPEVGAFVWCLTNWMKCENGPADPLQDFAEGGELGEFRRRLVEIVAAVDLPAAEFLTAEAAHRVAADHQETGGSRYEETDPLRLDGLPMSWTTGVLVRCGARWYVVDSEGYDWARYVLMPDNMGEMYAAELADFRAAYEAREAKKAAEAQRQAEARRADYLKRCARWAPLMEDVRPLMEAEKAAYGSREKSQIRKASAKLAAARRRNLVAMAAALFPGVKFSAKKWDGWGGSYELTWTDGPTEEHLKEAADFDLFESGRDTFDGMTDCAGVAYSEFTDFAGKYFGLFGEICFTRHHSEEFRQSIRDRIRAAVPGLPKGDQERITDGGQLSAICGMFPNVCASYIVQNLERYGLREAVAYITRCIDATPTQEGGTPSDSPKGEGCEADGAAYGNAEKSLISINPGDIYKVVAADRIVIVLEEVEDYIRDTDVIRGRFTGVISRSDKKLFFQCVESGKMVKVDASVLPPAIDGVHEWQKCVNHELIEEFSVRTRKIYEASDKMTTDEKRELAERMGFTSPVGPLEILNAAGLHRWNGSVSNFKNCAAIEWLIGQTHEEVAFQMNAGAYPVIFADYARRI